MGRLAEVHRTSLLTAGAIAAKHVNTMHKAIGIFRGVHLSDAQKRLLEELRQLDDTCAFLHHACDDPYYLQSISDRVDSLGVETKTSAPTSTSSRTTSPATTDGESSDFPVDQRSLHMVTRVLLQEFELPSPALSGPLLADDFAAIDMDEGLAEAEVHCDPHNLPMQSPKPAFPAR